MSSHPPPVANSLDSDDGGAGVQWTILATNFEAPFHGEVQSSEGSGSFAPADAFGNSGDSGVAVPAREDTGFYGVYQESDESKAAVLADKPEMSVQEIEEQSPSSGQEQEFIKCSEECTTQEQEFVKCSDKCATEVEVIVNEHNDSKSDGKLQGTMEKKKPRRRGGKARENNDILDSYSYENQEKKGLRYSREEMEALRFVELEEQKKKWIEVYCGLGPLAMEDYDCLAKSDKVHQKHTVPSLKFDPRLQFQKSVNLGEEVPENHLENLNTSDPSAALPISDEIGFSVMEEECSEVDDSDEDYDSILKPAFMVTGEPNFDAGPPQDGLEYLRRVRWETARIPKVKVAKVDKFKEQSPYMPQIPDVMKCPENLLPLKEWEDRFLSDFSELRQAFTWLDLQGSSATSSIELESAYIEDFMAQMLNITSVDDPCPSETPNVLETSDAKANPHSPEDSSSTVDLPTVSMILKMDPATRISKLKRRISSTEKMSRLSHHDFIWLFTLCAAIDCPLDADASAALRSLLRKCASLRAAKTDVDNEVVLLNILVTISGRYFGQLER